VLQGRPTREFGHKAMGTMASIGHLKGVAEVFGVSLSGLPAWLLWRAFYLSQMPTLRRKVRIFVEWTWGMFFPTDITHLRFTRSHESVQADRIGVGDRAGGSSARDQPGLLAVVLVQDGVEPLAPLANRKIL
jgi:NADH dehydrogenase